MLWCLFKLVVVWKLSCIISIFSFSFDCVCVCVACLKNNKLENRLWLCHVMNAMTLKFSLCFTKSLVGISWERLFDQ